ncbi:hypothetical protein ZIOFF_005131 [Zingiber officinale]|uniref:Protein transport protein Sec61 subunit beta n=2 Tax=Zingiber officinale TaxID=94328 RepID=A0A8J5M1C0_ZINOF|nr:hypothetical protein ZIOFF_005131 [Zingiber officinale]
MNHLNYAPRGPYQPLPAEYWQNMSHPYFTPSVVHGYDTPHTTGMSFTPSMSNEPATSTFIPETQLSDRESPIEVVNLEKTISNAEGTRKRSSWTKVEDEVLAKSFVTISDDPIIGNDQKADAFGGRVASYYNENLPLVKMVANAGGPPRGSAAAAASLRRRRTAGGGGAAAGGGASTMLQFYTDDAAGARMSPNTVLFMSIGFIAVVALLHVFGKLYIRH